MDEERLFHLALEKPAGERAAFLEEACVSNPVVREHLEALLRAYEYPDSFLGKPAVNLGAAVESPPDRHAGGGDSGATEDVAPGARSLTEGPGSRIGPYKLLQPIGEGGMGTVYMAEQTRPVRRLVALKVIKDGMDRRQVLARFEAERQALALMDHPNIAKVLDAGSTDSGRPYFVMELVKGIPITTFCDERRLTPRERLELFVPVCRAVQHAHQKGVIHRDLKPSNVLVALYDGRPVPRVIDFGVAKATGPKLTERTLFTEFGSIIGTPQYMSPEQAELNQLDVDTRSDIYSLGVLLYELLTGTTPLERRRLEETALLELLRLVREEEPPKPSTRLRTTAALPAIAERRGLEPKRLGTLVRGELDWIVMKCLEKDRNRRYETANSLATDLRRYLDDEPVLACPPTPAYRFRKFARRHKRALTMAGVALAGLLLAVIGLAASTVFIWRAKDELIRSLYFQSIALADREWSANHLARADEVLERCPPTLRGLEWRLLKRRLLSKAMPPLRHGNALFACAISPDGTQLVSSDLEGFLYVWDPSTGQELRDPIRAHDAVCYYVAFSPNGARLASAEDGGVKVWDAKTWREIDAWDTPTPMPAGSVQGLAFSPDGKLLACVCIRRPDGLEDVSIWDVLTGERLFALPEQRYNVANLTLSPDGTLLATASGDRTVKLWDARTGALIRTDRGDTTFRCVAFSPDGLLVAAGGGRENERGSGQVRIWDVATGRVRPISTGHTAWSVAFSPDGRRLATGGTDQAVKIWDTASGQEILTLRGHTDWVMDLAFSPDGHRLASASGDRTIRIWDASPLREGEPTGEALFTLRGHTDGVTALAFHPLVPRLASASTDGSLKLWDTQSGRYLSTIHPGIQEVLTLAFSPDGEHLAAAGGSDLFATVLDATTGTEVARPGEGVHTEPVSRVAFSPDGRYLASGDNAGLLLISDVTTGVVRRFPGGPLITALAFSPDPGERLLAVAAGDGEVQIWDTTTGERIAHPPLEHQGFIYGLAFSPDGQHLASSGWDRTVRIWDTATWERDEVIRDPAAAQCVAFSPDGRLLAWGTSDATVEVLRRDTGEIFTLRGHLDQVLGVAFSPGGKLIASASRDGTVKIWETPSSHEALGSGRP
ncbi:WD40 domain-containing protein [Tautonia plasticadhaerens]|uniref:Serine/threonine-protein kinase PknB n=1 Tax=Tautonia plasticadhaerens TaxID=2527974 RepID=A0A518GUV2_9BACT|nr:protein kinase [Tautonia plasticadhaerens]QDV32364.1 Serine/threonine-protein kinase PknB [Tautonia plasticadhaerens]